MSLYNIMGIWYKCHVRLNRSNICMIDGHGECTIIAICQEKPELCMYVQIGHSISNTYSWLEVCGSWCHVCNYFLLSCVSGVGAIAWHMVHTYAWHGMAVFSVYWEHLLYCSECWSLTTSSQCVGVSFPHNEVFDVVVRHFQLLLYPGHSSWLQLLVDFIWCKIMCGCGCVNWNESLPLR